MKSKQGISPYAITVRQGREREGDDIIIYKEEEDEEEED